MEYITEELKIKKIAELNSIKDRAKEEDIKLLDDQIKELDNKTIISNDAYAIVFYLDKLSRRLK